MKKILVILTLSLLASSNLFAESSKLNKIKYKFPKGECSPENCKEFKKSFLKPGKKYRFKADINYQRKAKNLSVKYYLDEELIAQHIGVPLSKKKTDGPYGPSKPYIKIGIYRIGETGTTSFAYNNLGWCFACSKIGRAHV